MTQLSLAKRVCYHYPYVMLAAILSADSVDGEDMSSLRADASNEGICYIRVIRSFDDGWYLVRAAVRPELLAEGYTVVLSEGQLAYALPWDCRLQHASPQRICIVLHAQARGLHPARVPVCGTKGLTTSQILARDPPVPLQLLDLGVVLSTEVLQDAIRCTVKEACSDTNTATNKENKKGLRSLRMQLAFVRAVIKTIYRDPTDHEMSTRIDTFHLQQALLRAVIDTLMEQLYQAQEHALAFALKALCALVAWVQRWQRQVKQRVMSVIPFFDEQRCQVVWQLLVGVPLSATLAPWQVQIESLS